MASAADLVVSLLEEAADTLAEPPERRYVSHGPEPAVDCDQLTTHIAQLRPKLLDQNSGDLGPMNCSVSWIVTLVVVLWRCVPYAQPGDAAPSADALDEAYTALAADGEALARGMTRKWATKVWPDGVECSEVQWQPLTPIGPQGGLAGWRLVVEVQL